MTDNRYRKLRFEVSLFPEEMEILQKKADDAGKTKTELIRDMIVYGKVESNKELSDVMQKMYSVLNDIDYQLRSKIYTEEAKEINGKASDELYQLKSQIEALTNLYADSFLFNGEE